MELNLKCPKCEEAMNINTTSNEHKCPNCGNIINLQIEETPSQQSTPNIKVEIVMPKSTSFFGRIKENNKKLSKIGIRVFIAFVVAKIIQICIENSFNSNLTFGELLLLNDPSESSMAIMGYMMLFYVLSSCLCLYLIALIIGAQIVKLNKTVEELKRISTEYPTKKTQIILFSILVLLPVGFILLIL